MCFKKPKAPKVTPDPELARQREEARRAAAEEREANKRARIDDRLSVLGGSSGRSLLFSQGGGGAGFAAPAARSLMVRG